METTMVNRGYLGIMETTIGFRVDGLGLGLYGCFRLNSNQTSMFGLGYVSGYALGSAL